MHLFDEKKRPRRTLHRHLRITVLDNVGIGSSATLATGAYGREWKRSMRPRDHLALRPTGIHSHHNRSARSHMSTRAVKWKGHIPPFLIVCAQTCPVPHTCKDRMGKLASLT